MRIKVSIRRSFAPAQIVIISFAAVIAIGTLLLSLPAATRSGERLPLVDAFFTAVSATCVTGLAVVDTGSHFSTFGQLVILSCIQVGGLGLMAFTSVFAVALGRRLPLADRLAVQQSFHHSATDNVRSLLGYIVAGTFLIEAIGAVILTAHWTGQNRFETFGETVYQAVFHSVSSFCNAGFSLFSDSLTGFQRDGTTLFVTSGLVITGGLGFLVGLELKEYLKTRYNRGRRRVPGERTPPPERLSVHTKFVVITTAALLAIGTVSYFVLERKGLFLEMGAGTAWLNSFFASVTARTAGFNTIDYGEMSGAALLCTMVLMFIGASPGSTGGGVKTSTFGVLVAYSISRWRGRRHLNAFSRTIPQLSIDRAAGVVIAAIVLVILALSVLMATETYHMTPRGSQGSFLTVAFETVSAFGTVGLSMGLTGSLDASSKAVVALVMFLGRIGPVTLALAVSRRERRAHFRYAEENIMVG